MKCYTYIEEIEEEKVLIYAKERNKLVDENEDLVISSAID